METLTPGWDDLRVLLAVHRDKSFLVAGKTLGVATSTVARRIAALEANVGRPLVHRRNDGARLDADALRLVALAEELERGLDALRRDGGQDSVSGTVRVSLSEGLVRPVTRLLARVRVKHPGLEVELVSESRNADLARGEADIGVRVGRTTAQAVVSRFVGRARTGLFAARSYVERRLPGARLARSAAATQEFVGFDRSLSRLPHEQWLREYGARRFVFRSNSASAIEQAVVSGVGIGLLSEAQGVALPELVQLDLEQAPPPVELYVAYHRDAKRTPRVQIVVKELVAEMRRQLA